VATVILGGLISSTILDFFVHPALFWCFGMRDAEKAIGKAGTDVLAASSR
jgi:HME family heavy-metal exporter